MKSQLKSLCRTLQRRLLHTKAKRESGIGRLDHEIKERVGSADICSSDDALGVNRVRDISWSGWWRIFTSVFKGISQDHVPIVSAGVAFFFFLALFPAIIASISIYSLVNEPSVIYDQVSTLSTFLPSQAYELIETALLRVEAEATLEWGAVAAILIAVWSSKKGINAVFEGINVAYRQSSRRGFVANNLLTLAFTAGALLFGLFILSLLALFPIVTEIMQLEGWTLILAKTFRWISLIALIVLALAMIYRVAPAREAPRFRWITPGSVIACALWGAGSYGFAWYVNNFGRFNETYGSFAAVVVLMLWFYLSAFIILLGAQINAEVEYQSNREN